MASDKTVAESVGMQVSFTGAGEVVVNAVEYARLKAQLAEAQATIAALQWTPITPDNLPKPLVHEVLDPVRGFVGTVFASWPYERSIEAGWLYFRPISPPAQASATEAERTAEQRAAEGATKRLTQLAQAVELAMREHQHQIDLGRQPYLWHVLRVAGAMGTDHEAVVIALLHDVVEDSGIGLGEILGTFGDLVGSAVWALSRQKGEPYFDYIKRLLKWSKAYPGGEVAVRVKLADLADNLRIDRLLLAQAHGADVARLVRKYVRAIATLEGFEL